MSSVSVRRGVLAVWVVVIVSLWLAAWSCGCHGKGPRAGARGAGLAARISKSQVPKAAGGHRVDLNLPGVQRPAPANAFVRQVKDISDPQLKAIADRVVAEMLLAMDKSVAHLAEPRRFPLPAERGALENIFARRLGQLPPAKQRAAVARVLPIMQASAIECRKHYGDLAAVDLSANASVAQQAKRLRLPVSLRLDRAKLVANAYSTLPGLGKEHSHTPVVILPVQHVMPLYRYYSNLVIKHFYSADLNDCGFGRAFWDYEGMVAGVYCQQKPGTVPLHRYRNTNSGDHYYMPGRDDAGMASKGYVYETIACYVYETEQPGTVAFNRYYNDQYNDHFYMIGRDDASLAARGFVFEGVTCYVLPYDTNAQPQGAADTIDYQINAVVCDEKISIVGTDTIWVGGTSISPTGNSSQLETFSVGDFGPGDCVAYGAGRTWASFSLAEGKNWPKTWFVTAVLCEKGHGSGFNDFMNQLLEAVKQEVKEYLTAAGIELGAEIGVSGGPVGILIGIAVGYAVDKVCEELMSRWNDDMFLPVTCQFSLDSPVVNWADDRFCSLIMWTHHGGKYNLVYNWHVYRK